MQMWTQQSFPEIGPEHTAFDLDARDFQDYKFLVGDVVVLYDRSTEEAQRWTITTVLDEMVSMRCLEADNRAKEKWHKCDGDKLIPQVFFNQSPRIVHRREVREEWLQRIQAMRAQAQKEAAERKARAQRMARQDTGKAASKGGSDSVDAASDEYDNSDGDEQQEDLYN